MPIDLLVMIFDQNGVTPGAWHALNSMRKNRSFGLENAVLVERDAAGKASIHHYKSYPTSRPILDDTFLTLFTNVLFTDSQGSRKLGLVIAELDEMVLEEITDAWEANSSALLIFIQRESLADTRKLLDHLSKFSGTLIHTTIPSRIIESILEQTKNVELPSMNNKEL